MGCSLPPTGCRGSFRRFSLGVAADARTEASSSILEGEFRQKAVMVEALGNLCEKVDLDL